MHEAICRVTHQRARILGLFCAVLCTGAGFSGAAEAADAPVDADAPTIPDALKPWVPWVLHHHRDDRCTADGSERHCAWPGALKLELRNDGATFTLDVWRDRAGDVDLPGDAKLWPQDIRAGEAAATVKTTSDGEPFVTVGAGHTRLIGRLHWSRPPEVVAIPADVAVLAVTRDGTAIQAPRREKDRLWLSGGKQVRDDTDTLRIEVQRRIVDGVPLRIATRLALKVAGKARDVVLGNVVVPGSIPVSVNGPLPVQIGRDGVARVHVRAGSHVITVDAVHPGAPKTLQVPGRLADADSHEVWVWVADTKQRSVQLSGLDPVDPERTSLPKSWRQGSTFMAVASKSLVLKQTRRGQPEPPPNRLQLRRELWLNLDGQAFSVRDRITGAMHRDWRLDYNGMGHLGRVSQRLQGRYNDVLITHPSGKGDTKGANQQVTGVELRTGKIDLRADLEMPYSPELEAIGWDFDARSVATTLHLPPGWKLLGATGVDQAPGTWIGSWTLFDFFLVLMVALGTGKLLGWRWSLIALLGLAICHGEDDAPRWVWLHLLAGIALVRVLPAGFVRKLAWVYRGGALLWMVLMLVPFSIHQVRHGLYPQVKQQSYNLGGGFAGDMEKKAEEAAAVAEALDDGVSLATRSAPSKKYKRRAMKGGGKPSGKKGYYQRVNQLQQVDPNAVVQTGPGLPDWSWSNWSLRWSGPVARGQKIGLILLSPTHNLVLAWLRVALLVALALLMLQWREIRGLFDDDAKSEPSPATASSSAVVIALAVGAALVLLPDHAVAKVPPAKIAPPPQQVQQQIQQQLQQVNVQNDLGNVANNLDDMLPRGPKSPSDKLLATLRARLLDATACKGPCTVASSAKLVLHDNTIALTAEVHAQRLAAWTLPGPLSTVRFSRVTVDGQPTGQLRRTDAGMLQVRLPKGRHTVVATGTLATRNVIAMHFADTAKPRRLTAKMHGWHIDGLGTNGVPDATLQLARKRAAAAPEEATSTTAGADLPPFFTVKRTLLLGLPWQVQTVVTRNRAEGPTLLKLPLLAGEAVLAAGIRVEESKNGAGKIALLHFPTGRSEVRMESELPVTAAIALTAPTGRPWTERWRLQCSPIFRCAAKGVAPVERQDASGEQVYAWWPWPGEKVDIAITRPDGAPGQAVTIDRVDYDVTPGKRLLEANLRLRVRSSRGGFRKITLPEGAELQRVTINNKERTIRPDGRVVSLPLKPGKQNFHLRWQQPWQRSFNETMPAVDIGGTAVNARLTIRRGEDRWLLWGFGPRWGPAVLFWSHVFVLFLLAIALGRIPNLPVHTGHWLLLGLGFVQLPVATLLVIVAWFVAMSWRRTFWKQRTGDDSAIWFDLSQLGLAALTLVALGCLYGAIHTNLLLDVDMQVTGAGSSNHELRWYVDRVDGVLPQPGMLSLPLLAWRLAMLTWSLWLVWALLRWLPWAWACFADGGLWRKTTPRKLQPNVHGETVESSVGPIPAPPPRPEPAADDTGDGTDGPERD